MINRKRILAASLIMTVMVAAGCAGSGNAGAGSAEAPAEAAQSAETVQETPVEGGDVLQVEDYRNEQGWSVRYDSAVIEVTEGEQVTFDYTGAAEGTNRILVTYVPDKMPDEALYDAMADQDGQPEHTRSEGYFAGRTDVWSIRTEMESKSAPNARDSFIAVERNGGTLLIAVTTTEQADEETGIAVSDALAAVIVTVLLEG